MRTNAYERSTVEVSGIHQHRLLIPVDATERSRWAIRYALRLKENGVPVSVVLIHVAEPVTAWEVRRFWTHAEIARLQAETGSHILEDAARDLMEAGIPIRSIMREGDIAFEILDQAERLECDEIVLPVPHARWVKLLSPDVVREVMRRQHSVKVTTVSKEGVSGSMQRH